MLKQLAMPSRYEVESALLKALLKHGGTIKEFGAGQEIVDEIANEFGLGEPQRTAFLQTVYRKENREKKALLWHRLLFRAADSLSIRKLVSRPSQTFKVTNKKEWMLTEKGFKEALNLTNLPFENKMNYTTKSFEVQKIANEILQSPRPTDYCPIDKEKRVTKVTRASVLRVRGFRHAVIDAYDYACSICGLKINSPDLLLWEVEAAHIVPHRFFGKDDIWNGLALCRIHHWAFDVGWLTLRPDFIIEVSPQIRSLQADFGRFGEYEFIRSLYLKKHKIQLPKRIEIHPHPNAINWHRQNVFYK